MHDSTEREILEAAAQAVEQTTGMQVKLLIPSTGDLAESDAGIAVRHGEVESKFQVEVKANLTRPVAALAVEQLAGSNAPVLVVTSYVNPRIGELLKEANICFADTVGNVYINEPPIFIYVTGNKPADYQRTTKPTGRAFRTKGLQVLFALLCNPGLEDDTFRKIAELSGVALGTVDRVIKELLTMDFLRQPGKSRRRIIRRDDLLRRWVEAYPEQLEGKILKGRYTAKDPLWWQKADIGADGALWGGEVAAAKITGYLKPLSIQVYVKEISGKMLVTNRLTRSPDGRMEILDRFWNFEFEWMHKDLVPPLLIYADLMASGNVRNIETARIIYEEHLTRLIRED